MKPIINAVPPALPNNSRRAVSVISLNMVPRLRATTLAHGAGRHHREAATEEQGEQQSVECHSQWRGGNDDACKGTVACLAPPSLSPGFEQGSEIEHQVLIAAFQGACAEPPDDQGDQGKGAAPLQELNGR